MLVVYVPIHFSSRAPAIQHAVLDIAHDFLPRIIRPSKQEAEGSKLLRRLCLIQRKDNVEQSEAKELQRFRSQKI